MKEIAEVNIDTMTSREIAKLTGKTHKNILADIRKQNKALQSAEISAHYKDSKGRQQIEILLDKESTIILVSGYNVHMRAAVVRRWKELEQAVRELDVVSKVKAIALTGDFNEATKAVTDLCKDSEQVGKVGSKLMTERKRQKREAKKLIEEVSSRFQLNLF